MNKDNTGKEQFQGRYEVSGEFLQNAQEYEPRYNDSLNAEEFVKMFKDEIKYVPQWGKWLYWTGKRWRVDEKYKILYYTSILIGSYYSAASRIEHIPSRRKLVDFAQKSESERGRNSIINLAKAEKGVSISSDLFDIDRFLLNTLSGTYNLKTFELYPYDYSQYITKLIPAEFNPEAECPKWLKFLHEVMNNNEELISFLQRAVGYSLTGETRERCLFILHGPGANGKTTFINVLINLFGGLKEYVRSMDASSIMIKWGSSVSNDIARLAGVRTVTTCESNKRAKFNEGLLKQLTGEDPVTARFLYRECFDFYPQFKIWFATNYKPEVSESDDAVWSRIKLIPFSATFPEEKQDKELKSKLIMELPGILNWAIEGCKRWQEEGLGVPEEVKKATNIYRTEQDDLGEFLSEYCDFNDKEHVQRINLESESRISLRNKRIYIVQVGVFHKKYMDETGDKISRKSFGQEIRRKGFISHSFGGKVYWVGIRIKETESSLPTKLQEKGRV